jgi:hypothetical protein
MRLHNHDLWWVSQVLGVLRLVYPPSLLMAFWETLWR